MVACPPHCKTWTDAEGWILCANGITFLCLQFLHCFTAYKMEQLMRGLGQGGLGGMQVRLLAFALFLCLL